MLGIPKIQVDKLDLVVVEAAGKASFNVQLFEY
jgi:hypothetical protein